MEQERKTRVAITHGDTNSTNYEVLLKAFEDPTMLELFTPIIYGSPKVATYHRKSLGLETQYSAVTSADDAKDGRLNLLTTTDEEIKVEIGQPTAEADAAAKKALDKALADAADGKFDALVVMPAKANDAIQRQQGALPVIVSENLRLAFVTKDVAIKEVSEAITKQKITEKAKTLHTCLRRDLSISSPRIAVLALNPHAGTEGKMGEEEQSIIVPAIAELEQQGIQAFGPYPADNFFGNGDYLRFDAVLAMYYDQGMTPLKTLATDDYTMLTAGLPMVCTAPGTEVMHATAGKGTAEPDALRHAIYLAIDVARNRSCYDEPLANPLPKLYHEKRDDSEKVRFAVPKTKEQSAPKMDKKQ